MAAEQDDRTEPATQRRREETREKGQVVKSREVTSVAVLLAGIVYFKFFSGYVGETIARYSRFFFEGAAIRDMGPNTFFVMVMEGVNGVGWVLLPLLGIVVLFSVAAHFFQFGFLFSPQALTPKFSKLNPLEGAKRLLGKQGWMDLFKSIAKVILVGYVSYVTFQEIWFFLPQLSQMAPAGILAQFADFAMKIALRCAGVLVFLAGLDYAFQRYSFEKSIMMTKDEVKQEYKQREGDPMVKARIRQVQREISRKRMMSAVPKADVVITNPTHYAIAIAYRREEMEAPVVVAKGKGYIARRIREVAEENKVPLFEDKPLAQGLYKAVQIGQTIPTEFYKAVAEILAYVYSLKRKAA